MQPDELSPEQIAPDLIGLGAQSIVDNAKRLGLEWTLRIATVLDGTNPLAVSATYDSDPASIDMTSMIGYLAGGQRVYVIAVPPSGNFIVGLANWFDRSYYGIGNQTGTLGTTGVEAAIPLASWAEEPNVTVQVNQIVKVTVSIVLFPSAATNSVAAVRVRKGSVTTSGTQLYRWATQLVTQAASNSNSFSLIGYFKNTASVAVSTQLSITLQAIGGAASVSVFSDADFPLIVETSPHSIVGLDPVFDARLVSV